MSTATEMTALREALTAVVQQHEEAVAAQAARKADWQVAAAEGNDKAAEKLEADMDRAARVLQRLELRRTALEQEIGSAEEVERAANAAKLKATCDAVLARATKRIADMAPLAAALAKAVDDLEGDFADWKEARHYAKVAGAAPESFATQENERHVSELVESLGLSRIRAGNISKELSRVSVFM